MVVIRIGIGLILMMTFMIIGIMLNKHYTNPTALSHSETIDQVSKFVELDAKIKDKSDKVCMYLVNHTVSEMNIVDGVLVGNVYINCNNGWRYKLTISDVLDEYLDKLD